MVDLPGEDTVKDIAAVTVRQGPLALLAVMMVGAMLAGIGCLGYILVPVMRDYVSASTETLEANARSFASLSQSMSAVHQAHAAMMTASSEVQTAVLTNGEKIDELSTIVMQMASIVDEARVLMQGVPTQRLQQHEEQLKKLQSIDDSLQQLLTEIKASQP